MLKKDQSGWCVTAYVNVSVLIRDRNALSLPQYLLQDENESLRWY